MLRALPGGFGQGFLDCQSRHRAAANQPLQVNLGFSPTGRQYKLSYEGTIALLGGCHTRMVGRPA
jgi:hypothetical protein